MFHSSASFFSASRKRVSTLRAQGGLHAGFQDFQGLNGIVNKLFNQYLSFVPLLCSLLYLLALITWLSA
jgi:hypothetical protein